MKVEIPGHANAILEYTHRIFKRDSFIMSLTPEERELRMVAA